MAAAPANVNTFRVYFWDETYPTDWSRLFWGSLNCRVTCRPERRREESRGACAYLDAQTQHQPLEEGGQLNETASGLPSRQPPTAEFDPLAIFAERTRHHLAAPGAWSAIDAIKIV